MTVRLEFYFDYSSPFAYLASTQVERIAKAHAAELVYRPFLLGALFKEIGTPLVPIAAMSEAKRKYVLVDMYRWAAHRRVPLNYPSRFPLRTVAALRMTLSFDGADRAQLVPHIMKACWVDDRDPEDRSVLRACAEAAGLDPAVVDELDSEPSKERLRAATSEAVLRQVPGAPTFVVGDELFWGQDRLHFVERALQARAG